MSLNNCLGHATGEELTCLGEMPTISVFVHGVVVAVANSESFPPFEVHYPQCFRGAALDVEGEPVAGFCHPDDKLGWRRQIQECFVNAWLGLISRPRNVP